MADRQKHRKRQWFEGPALHRARGPVPVGKTTLLEAILARAGAVHRPGTVEAGTRWATPTPRRARTR